MNTIRFRSALALFVGAVAFGCGGSASVDRASDAQAPSAGGNVAATGGSTSNGGQGGSVAGANGGGSGAPGTGGRIGSSGGMNSGPDAGRVLDASRTGTGGTPGVPHATPLGGSCLQDIDCSVGLACMPASSNALGGGGPPGGLCTIPCNPNGNGSECTVFDPAAACVTFDNAATTGVCLEGCTPGQTTGQKCQGRVNFACDPRGFCSPTCTGTGSECGPRKCDLGTGVCRDSVTGTLPIGSSCSTATMPDACRGNCERFSGGGTHVDTMCTGRCQLGGTAGCGVDVASTATFDSFCIFGSADSGTGDLGACAQLCDCNADCLDKELVCSALPTQLIVITGRAGVCASPFAVDAGVDPGITCTKVPDAGTP